MKITRDEVRNVAVLGRLELSENEERAFAADLDRILSYVDMLNELDTANVEPTAHVASIEAPFREDRLTGFPNSETLVAGAPARVGTYFKVPKIID